MAIKRAAPRHTLAVNLRRLMEKSGLTAPEVAARARVDRKTVNNQLNGRFDPRLQQVESVANVFGLSCWQLLSPDLNPEHATPEVQQLLDIYIRAGEQNRQNLIRLAQLIGNTDSPP